MLFGVWVRTTTPTPARCDFGSALGEKRKFVHSKAGENAGCDDVFRAGESGEWGAFTFGCPSAGPPPPPGCGWARGDYRFSMPPSGSCRDVKSVGLAYFGMTLGEQVARKPAGDPPEARDIDFIVWTGDLIPHNLWNTTREGNLDVTRQAIQMVRTVSQDSCVPGHRQPRVPPRERFSLNRTSRTNSTSLAVRRDLALWATWLPADVAASVTYSAFYSTLIKPGLRILSINTNYCYSFNWWLLFDDVDPAAELAWMAQELQRAEDAGEKAYVVSHHPPGHRDCSKTWSHQYNRIVHSNAYGGTIKRF
ncbi:sphingomyelin phosphodiesterase-like [Penaeus monodon]|uniref:sphingomyelin phosphodiesterase-like n=1 Tax=Penaeus monodon TaxID=6687 RepID=UPI0018A7447D|nr:sphingomyelin phosphodiesterase-like [Penaeus monodon]